MQSVVTRPLLFLQVGVQVFTRRPLEEQQSSFNPDDVLTCLKKYPKALVRYLEHLVMDRKLQVSTAQLGAGVQVVASSVAETESP